MTRPNEEPTSVALSGSAIDAELTTNSGIHIERHKTVTTFSLPFSKQTHSESRSKDAMPYVLLTIQALLALTFLFAGAGKFFMSAEELTKDSNLSASFLRFIGVCEVLGAFGLILPGLVDIRRGLTPLAASGLAIIMVGAVVVTIQGMGVAPALLPLVVGMFAAFVAYNRRSWFTTAQ